MEVLKEEELGREEVENPVMGLLLEEEEKEEMVGLKKKYTREEMEALRFVQLDYQLRRFEQVYWGLELSTKEVFHSIFEPDSKNKKRNRNRNKNKNRNKQRNKGLDLENKHEEIVIGEEVELNQFGPAKYEDYDISDDDKYDGILKPAFLVEGEPDFDSGPPLDGLEYLRRVRWEANQIPDVNIANLNLSEICNEQTPYMPKLPELPKCPPSLLPSIEWQDYFLTQFSDLRKSISELVISMNQDQNQPFPQIPETTSIEESISTLFPGSIRSLHSTFQLDTSSEESESTPRTIPNLLKMDSLSRASTLRNHVANVEISENLSSHDCLWLFALCASVDEPLSGNTCASLRNLLRKCFGLIEKKEEIDDDVAMLSVLVIICGKYFGQYDK